MIAGGRAATENETYEQGLGEPCVWVSNASVNSELTFGFRCQMFEDDQDTYLAHMRAFNTGVAVTGAHLPRVMWIDVGFAKGDRRQLPHLFSAGGFLAVSEAFADVLRRFDLGRTQLHPVEFLKSNRKEPFEGRYYLLNIAEVHRYFSPEHSARWKRFNNRKTSYIGAINFIPKDGDITVAPAALAGPALWLDDTLSKSLFFSDQLVRALRDEKLTDKLPLYRCPVAPVN